MLALALGAAAAWRERRMRIALACAVGCALLRVEAWPFVAAAGVLLWRARPRDRVLLAALAFGIPAAWLVPELIGSATCCARAPARASRTRASRRSRTCLASRRCASRRAAAVAAVGRHRRADRAPRSRGARARRSRRGLDRARRADGAGRLRGRRALCAPRRRARRAQRRGRPRARRTGRGSRPAAASGSRSPPSSSPSPPLPAWRAAGLAVRAGVPVAAGRRPGRRRAGGGGAEAVLACGRPFVGRLRGPLMAYRIGVAKHVVEPDDPPRRRHGLPLRAAPRRGARTAAPRQFAPVARSGELGGARGLRGAPRA